MQKGIQANTGHMLKREPWDETNCKHINWRYREARESGREIRMQTLTQIPGTHLKRLAVFSYAKLQLFEGN